MPADEDYGRRQISLSQQQQHSNGSVISGPTASQSTIVSNNSRQQQVAANDACSVGMVATQQQPLHCGATCLSASDQRYSSEKNLVRHVDSSPVPPSSNHHHENSRYMDRFVPERPGSDRLPSGERYQGVSERYPLGERPQTSVSSERLLQTPTPQQERYQYVSNQRYPERYTPIQHLVGSLDRYQAHATLDRYSRTSTPTDRYHTLSSDKESCSSTNERYAPVEERHSSTQNICSIERYTPTERQHTNSKTDLYKHRERSSSSDRKSAERYQQYQNRYGNEQYVNERYQSNDRFPAIPCPERFASQERTERPERMPFSQVPYMEPPSPAPAGDRFIPPPPLSPDNSTSPDCFPNNSFPSPTTTVPPSERFIPPPPLSPSPTEAYSPKKQRYHDRYPQSPNRSDRYHNTDQRYKDITQYYPTNERYPTNNSHQTNYHQDKYVNNKYNNNDRYVSPNPHMPVDRYIPEETYFQNYERYPKYNTTDPYMRRDLNFHYRLPIPYSANQYQRIRYVGTSNRIKCCQYQDSYQHSKSSPGSSSSSSVTSSQGKDLPHKDVQSCLNISLQDIQCQNYPPKEYQCNYQQQEKGTQCSNLQCQQQGGFASPNLRTVNVNAVSIKGQCRHSICASPSIEYVGASGGRHVCATPPPRGCIGSGDGSLCNENCCMRRSQNSLTVAVW